MDLAKAGREAHHKAEKRESSLALASFDGGSFPVLEGTFRQLRTDRDRPAHFAATSGASFEAGFASMCARTLAMVSGQWRSPSRSCEIKFRSFAAL